MVGIISTKQTLDITLEAVDASLTVYGDEAIAAGIFTELARYFVKEAKYREIEGAIEKTLDSHFSQKLRRVLEAKVPYQLEDYRCARVFLKNHPLIVVSQDLVNMQGNEKLLIRPLTLGSNLEATGAIFSETELSQIAALERVEVTIFSVAQSAFDSLERVIAKKEKEEWVRSTRTLPTQPNRIRASVAPLERKPLLPKKEQIKKEQTCCTTCTIV
ncbi:MAG: hypothetical protein K0S74_795 [Chlamydiales bacterium]|jgi:hypothetical protein|nr:hypothetical protein [Chlamydiales bacterium]